MALACVVPLLLGAAPKVHPHGSDPTFSRTAAETINASVCWSSECFDNVVRAIGRGAAQAKAPDPRMAFAVDLATNMSGVVLDVGAFGGKQTTTAAIYGGRRVYAFECQMDAVAKLKGQVPHEGVTIVHACGGSSAKLSKLYKAQDSSSLVKRAVTAERASRMKVAGWESKGQPITEDVVVVPLGLFFQSEQAALIKVDVQGMELEVLRGLQDVIQRDLPVVMYERDNRVTHGDMRLDPFRHLLHKLDYTCPFRTIMNRDDICLFDNRTGVESSAD